MVQCKVFRVRVVVTNTATGKRPKGWEKEWLKVYGSGSEAEAEKQAIDTAKNFLKDDGTVNTYEVLRVKRAI